MSWIGADKKSRKSDNRESGNIHGRRCVSYAWGESHLTIALVQFSTGINSVTRTIGIVFAAVPALSALAAHAQSASPANLPAVTVTATQGVVQSAFDAPASVDILGAATLHDGQQQVNLSETLSRAPGLFAQNRQNYAQDLQISSRGFGARSTFGVRGIRLYLDGIPATMPDGQGQVSHFDLPSAARVEVLRGPFSALYGNSSGGVISVFTEDGGPETVATADAALGSYGLERQNVQLSGSQGQVRYRLSATHFDTDGWRPHSAAERSTFNAKASTTLEDGTRLALVGNAMDLPLAQDPLGLSRAELHSNPAQVTPSAVQFDTRKSASQQQVGATLRHRFASGEADVVVYAGTRATTQYQAIPVAAQLAPTHPGGVIDLARTYEGLDARYTHRALWAGRAASLTFGVSANSLLERRRGYQNFVGATLGVQGSLRRNETNTARNLDEYAQLQWEIAADWTLTAGLRHSSVRVVDQDHYIVPGNGDDSGSARYTANTPVVGVVFHVSDALNLYASAGRGFETPTLNELAYRANGSAGLNTELRASTSNQWEAGAKYKAGSNWLLTAAYFRARTANEITVLSNVGGRSVYQNAGSTLRDGVELSAAGQWRAWWTQLAATSMRATFLPGSSVNGGNHLPGAPDTTLFAELGWRNPRWGFESAVEWRYVGRIYVDDANSDSAAPSRVMNLRAVWTQPKGRWRVQEFVRIDNLLNANYVGSVIVNESSRRFFEPGLPRNWTIGAQASYTF